MAIRLSEAILEDRKKEDELIRQWKLGDYVGTCPKCLRVRLCICTNGLHRCEKCNWCPEKGEYVNI